MCQFKSGLTVTAVAAMIAACVMAASILTVIVACIVICTVIAVIVTDIVTYAVLTMIVTDIVTDTVVTVVIGENRSLRNKNGRASHDRSGICDTIYKSQLAQTGVAAVRNARQTIASLNGIGRPARRLCRSTISRENDSTFIVAESGQLNFAGEQTATNQAD